MSYAVFDTNILVDHLKGREEATSVLRQCIESGIVPACSVITRIELMSGMRADEEARIEYLISGFEEISIDAMLAKTAGEYMNNYRKSHGINMGDAIIAATAKMLNSKLYTLNIRHFPMGDIKVARPY